MQVVGKTGDVPVLVGWPLEFGCYSSTAVVVAGCFRLGFSVRVIL